MAQTVPIVWKLALNKGGWAWIIPLVPLWAMPMVTVLVPGWNRMRSPLLLLAICSAYTFSVDTPSGFLSLPVGRFALGLLVRIELGRHGHGRLP